MRSFVTSSLVLLAAFLVGTASCEGPSPSLTNAQRLQRGLHPNPPRSHIRPSRVRRQGVGSPLPNIAYTGRIAVYTSGNDELQGYLSNVGTSFHWTDSDSSRALTYEIILPAGEMSGTQLNVKIKDSPFSFSFLGPAIRRSGPNLGSGVPNDGVFAATSQTSPGAPATWVPNSFSGIAAESAVWTFDVPTGSLTPVWINPDGSSAPTYVVHRGQSPYFTGDVQAFQSYLDAQAAEWGGYEEPLVPVYFHFELIIAISV